MIFFTNLEISSEILEIWGHDKYEKCSEELKLFDGRTLRFIRTHPEELHVKQNWS